MAKGCSAYQSSVHLPDQYLRVETRSPAAGEVSVPSRAASRPVCTARLPPGQTEVSHTELCSGSGDHDSCRSTADNLSDSVNRARAESVMLASPVT